MHNLWESTEGKIKKLEGELHTARHTILNMLPDELHQLLTSYYECKSEEETIRWEYMVAEKLLEHVKIIPCDQWRSSDRAFCPLCGSGSQGPFDEGYAIPEGLRRHITGYGNVRRCSVFEQIHQLAEEYWDYQLAEQKRRENEKANILLKARKEKKNICLVGPDSMPVLIGGKSYSCTPLRNKEQLKWAEARLESLGFEKIIKDNEISYVYDDGEICIFANPLVQKRIDFQAYKCDSNVRSHSYTLPDYYKNKLKEKIESFIFEAKNK